MSEQTETKKVTTQSIVNVSDEQKATIAGLKKTYNLTDKGVIELLLNVALNNQVGLLPDENEVPQEVDTFAIVVDGLNLAKKVKTEKVVLTEEEKAAAKEAKKQERLRKKLAELQAQLTAEVNGTTVTETSDEEIETEDSEPETLVEIGV